MLGWCRQNRQKVQNHYQANRQLWVEYIAPFVPAVTRKTYPMEATVITFKQSISLRLSARLVRAFLVAIVATEHIPAHTAKAQIPVPIEKGL
jgi:hypothetical protein